MWSFLQRIFARPPTVPVKDRPATPAEAQAAISQLQLAHRFFTKAWDDREYTDRAMRHLSMAAEAVNKARGLDPTAVVVVEQYGEPTKYSVDGLTAHILFSQSELLVYGANLLLQEISTDLSPEAIRDAQRKSSGYKRDAIDAAQKALRYDPTNVKYRLALAKAFKANQDKKAARRAVDEVLSADPHNLDALELKAELR